MKTILVAVDGSDHSHRAVELAADIAVKYDAKLVLVHAVDSRPLSDGERRLAEAEYADRIGPRMAARLICEHSVMLNLMRPQARLN